jgi:MscS family membrane protein
MRRTPYTTDVMRDEIRKTEEIVSVDFLLTYVDHLSWMQIIIGAITLLVTLVLRKLFANYIFKFILKLTKKTKTDIDTMIALAFEKPLQTLIVMIGLYVFLVYAGHVNPTLLNKPTHTVVVILIAWGFFNLTSSSSLWIDRLARRYGVQLDDILVPMLSKILRLIIVVLTITIVAQEFGYNINGLVAGIGLGGLAFALAAKDVIGNFFGGVIIVLEKPFALGDWIKTPTVEGTVESISFRSTKIRTFAQGLVTVPNFHLVNEAITNWSKMGKRRITFDLGVEYSTSVEKLRTCVAQIREMLENHSEIEQETIFVRFQTFNQSSLDIFLYFFTKTTDWGEWLRIREDCNFRIMGILEREGVKVAFPSRSIYVETLAGQSGGGAGDDSGAANA